MLINVNLVDHKSGEHLAFMRMPSVPRPGDVVQGMLAGKYRIDGLALWSVEGNNWEVSIGATEIDGTTPTEDS